jgi:hypothetical protein
MAGLAHGRQSQRAVSTLQPAGGHSRSPGRDAALHPSLTSGVERRGVHDAEEGHLQQQPWKRGGWARVKRSRDAR